MLTVTILRTNRTATTNGQISLARAAGLGKYSYGNGFTVTERISGTGTVRFRFTSWAFHNFTYLKILANIAVPSPIFQLVCHILIALLQPAICECIQNLKILSEPKKQMYNLNGECVI